MLDDLRVQSPASRGSDPGSVDLMAVASFEPDRGRRLRLASAKAWMSFSPRTEKIEKVHTHVFAGFATLNTTK